MFNHLWLFIKPQLAESHGHRRLSFVVIKAIAVKIFESLRQTVIGRSKLSLRRHDSSAGERGSVETPFVLLTGPGANQAIDHRSRSSEIPYLQVEQRSLFKELRASQTDPGFAVSARSSFVVFVCSVDFRLLTIKIAVSFERLCSGARQD